MSEPFLVPTEIALLVGILVGLLVGWVARALHEGER